MSGRYTSINKKHLKNVGPIRYCESPHAHSSDVASGTVARRLHIDVHDDNDNAWQRGPLWPHGMGPINHSYSILTLITVRTVVLLIMWKVVIHVISKPKKLFDQIVCHVWTRDQSLIGQISPAKKLPRIFAKTSRLKNLLFFFCLNSLQHKSLCLFNPALRLPYISKLILIWSGISAMSGSMPRWPA